MKSISTINPIIMENTECTVVKERAPVIGIRVGVSPQHTVYHYASFRFQLFERLANILSKE